MNNYFSIEVLSVDEMLIIRGGSDTDLDDDKDQQGPPVPPPVPPGPPNSLNCTTATTLVVTLPDPAIENILRVLEKKAAK